MDEDFGKWKICLGSRSEGLAVVQLKPGESTEEAWKRHLGARPRRCSWQCSKFLLQPVLQRTATVEHKRQ